VQDFSPADTAAMKVCTTFHQRYAAFFFNVVQDFSPADTADLKVCTTFFLCGAPSVNTARNIPGGATNDKYAKSKQLSVIGIGLILAKVDKKYPAYSIQ
jgi:hypothetical protein